MTPAEFEVVLNARVQNRKDLIRTLDQINGRNCEIIWKAHGGKDVDADDFRTYRKEGEDMTAEQWEDYLRTIALTYKPPAAI